MSKTFWFGLIIMVIGIVVALAGPSWVGNNSGAVGDTSVSVSDSSGIPSWVGWVIGGVGLLLMISGVRSRRTDTDVTVVKDTLIHEDHHPRTS